MSRAGTGHIAFSCLHSPLRQVASSGAVALSSRASDEPFATTTRVWPSLPAFRAESPVRCSTSSSTFVAHHREHLPNWNEPQRVDRHGPSSQTVLEAGPELESAPASLTSARITLTQRLERCPFPAFGFHCSRSCMLRARLTAVDCANIDASESR
ncbi:hypothetical protein BCV70DRAFT_199653 [Testicularia cyperi]|uniref:Uncharacterized protein n=1 Tax=Testicularia cyperi TaxID=1882483 RepID=A0A317XQ25_9BASI|nr:hypothetical protein BCV70DRAFT_199653 [Testicularia cyperi]